LGFVITTILPICTQKLEHTHESDLEYYEHRYYNKLKDDYYNFKIFDSIYRCLFCYNKDYSLTDLLRYASIIAGNSCKTIKDIAKHYVLITYIQSYLNVKVDENKPLDVNIVSDKPHGVGIASEPVEGYSVTDEYVQVKSLIVTTIPPSMDFNGRTTYLFDADTKKSIDTSKSFNHPKFSFECIAHDLDASLLKQDVIYLEVTTNMTISLSLKVAAPDYGFQNITRKITAAPECGIPSPPLKPLNLQSPPPMSKKPSNQHVAISIQHVTTCLQ